MRAIDAVALRRKAHNRIWSDDKGQPILGPLEKAIRWQVEKLIKDATTIKIESTRVGEWKIAWIRNGDGLRNTFFCSRCKKAAQFMTDYCPCCGAWMRGKNERDSH